MKHTPFKVEQYNTDIQVSYQPVDIVDAQGNRIARISNDSSGLELAAFIVQACNSFDDLVKALTNLAEYAAHEIGLQVADCVAGPIGEASAALKRAKGEA